MRRILSRLGAMVAVMTVAGCASSLNRGNAVATVPYTIAAGGRIIVDVMLDSDGPFRFAVDTAATASFVTVRVRDELGLVPLPDVTATVHGVLASGEFPVIEIDQLTIGGAIWADALLTTLPATSGATSNVDGVLGADFLHQYSVELVTSDDTLLLYPRDALAAERYRGWTEVGMQPRFFGRTEQPLHFLDIEIGGRAIAALFDLGAGVSLLNTEAAEALRLAPLRSGERAEFAGALGSTEIEARLSTQDLNTGRVAWRNESFLITDAEIFSTLGFADEPLAILGSGLFTQRDFIIDYTRDRLLIRTAMSEIE